MKVGAIISQHVSVFQFIAFIELSYSTCQDDYVQEYYRVSGESILWCTTEVDATLMITQ